MTPALAVHDLAIDFLARRGPVRAVDGTSLNAASGEVLGIVGESGSGKSTLGMAIGRLLVSGAARSSGDILVGGRSVFTLSEPALRALRAKELGFVFQDPIGTLDPTRRIGLQIKAALGAAQPALKSRRCWPESACLTLTGWREATRTNSPAVWPSASP